MSQKYKFTFTYKGNLRIIVGVICRKQEEDLDDDLDNDLYTLYKLDVN